MSSKSNIKLTIAFANPDLDPEEQEQETRNLLEEIKDFDVESPELVTFIETPAGTKLVGGFLL